MFIDSHVHGIHADKDASGKLVPPLQIAWHAKGLVPNEGYKEITPEDYIEISKKEYGVEKVVLLDPPDLTFKLKEIFKDYVIAVPMVDIDSVTPDEINALFKRGAVGIKFIVPSKSYGDDSYFPLYAAIAANHGLAVFHTGFVLVGRFEPLGWDPRKTIVNITDMRPAALDRIARAFPDLKMLMAHFGNPWWDEALNMCASHKNIYADFSGGTCYRRSMDMWAQIFSPDGKLDSAAAGKLCFGTDAGYFTRDVKNEKESVKEIMDFYFRFMERLKVPEELRQKICRNNILMLTDINEK